MPQADLYYSADQTLSARELLAEVERVIAAIDDRSGTTKGRGHRVEDFHHSHVYLAISMLPKPDRDATYANRIKQAVADALRPKLAPDTLLNVNVRLDLHHYL